MGCYWRHRRRRWLRAQALNTLQTLGGITVFAPIPMTPAGTDVIDGL